MGVRAASGLEVALEGGPHGEEPDVVLPRRIDAVDPSIADLLQDEERDRLVICARRFDPFQPPLRRRDRSASRTGGRSGLPCGGRRVGPVVVRTGLCSINLLVIVVPRDVDRRTGKYRRVTNGGIRRHAGRHTRAACYPTPDAGNRHREEVRALTPTLVARADRSRGTMRTNSAFSRRSRVRIVGCEQTGDVAGDRSFRAVAPALNDSSSMPRSAMSAIRAGSWSSHRVIVSATSSQTDWPTAP